MFILQVLFGSAQFYIETPTEPTTPGQTPPGQQALTSWGPDDYYHAGAQVSNGLNLVNASTTLPRVHSAWTLLQGSTQAPRLLQLAQGAEHVINAQKVLAMANAAEQATCLSRMGLTFREVQFIANAGRLTAGELRMVQNAGQIGRFGRFVLACGTKISPIITALNEARYVGWFFKSVGWICKAPVRLFGWIGKGLSWIPGVARLGALGGGRAIPILGGILAVGDCALSWATALNEQDPAKRQSLMIQAGINTGCTVAGAVIGGIIGSIVPGAGTFLGACIGASIGNLVGNAINFIGFSDNVVAQGIRSAGSFVGNVVTAPFRGIGRALGWCS